MAIDPKAELVQTRLDELNRSAKWLARQLGMNHQSVYNYLEGKTVPRDPSVFDKMLNELASEKRKRNPGAPETVGPFEVAEIPKIKLPIVGTASAGHGPVSDLDEGLYVPFLFSDPTYSGLIVVGDSLMPALESGTTVIVKEHHERRAGLVMAIRTAPDEIRLKKLEWSPLEGTWMMVSANPNYEAERVPEGAQVLGYIVGFYKSSHGREDFSHAREGLKLF